MFSTRPEKRIGSDQSWDYVEGALESAIKATGAEFELDPGEGAFYGARLDFKLTDAIGRECSNSAPSRWTPNLPERLGAS